MPQVDLVKVVSCNVQDSKYPAANLLHGKIGKWLCPMPRRNSSIDAVFMLERSCIIGGLNIGNHGSAFVTVSVSHYGSSEFHTLLPSSVLLDRQQSKGNSVKSSVVMFSRDKFCENVRDKKWGILKITCTQPFESHNQFGLSFVHILSYEKENIFPDDKGKENRIMTARRNLYNKTIHTSKEPEVIHKMAAASPRSLELVKACMNIQNSEVTEKLPVQACSPKEKPLREYNTKAETKPSGILGTYSGQRKCPVCSGLFELSEFEAHTARCASSPNRMIAAEEINDVMCPVCKRKFSAESIESHADACAQRLESTSKNNFSASPPAMENRYLKKYNERYEPVQGTSPNSEEKDYDFKLRKRVMNFLESEKVAAKQMKHGTIGELKRLYEQATNESLQSHEIKKFAAIVRIYLRAHADPDEKKNRELLDSENTAAKHPECRRNLLSLEDSGNVQARDEYSDGDLIRNVIIHSSPTDKTGASQTPKRKNMENAHVKRKRLANGMHSSQTTAGSSVLSDEFGRNSAMFGTSDDIPRMVQCDLCEEFFSVSDIGIHSSTCIVPADRYNRASSWEACPICDELVKRDSIEEHATLCAEKKFG